MFGLFDGKIGDQADWMQALLSAALDETGDPKKAIALVNAAFEKAPQSPVRQTPSGQRGAI